MLTKRDLRLITLLIFFLVIGILNKIEEKKQNTNSPSQNNPPQESSPSAELFKVTRVIDGDTIELENGIKVRYIGIDTPETVAPNKPDGCFGKEASNKNRELVEGKTVSLEKDVSETDRYGRLLRYVYVNNILVNDYLVRQGYANAVSYPPDIKRQQQLIQAEREARKNFRGQWSACSFETTSSNNNP